jgi:hypothetical protein
VGSSRCAQALAHAFPGYLGTAKLHDVKAYKFTDYFENEVLPKRPYLKKEWCIQVLENPLRSEPQEKNRFRFWGTIPEFDNRILRVVTLEDRVTLHNAFPDRRFKP